MNKVVIVDDESIIVEGLCKTLPWEQWNCKVVATASDGEEGRKIIEQYQPDLVFSDIAMPGVDGLILNMHRRQCGLMCVDFF